MRSSDIVSAYGAVHTTSALREKLMLLAEDAEDSDTSESSPDSLFPVETDKTRGRGAVGAVCAMAAALALVFAARALTGGNSGLTEITETAVSVTETVVSAAETEISAAESAVGKEVLPAREAVIDTEAAGTEIVIEKEYSFELEKYLEQHSFYTDEYAPRNELDFLDDGEYETFLRGVILVDSAENYYMPRSGGPDLFLYDDGVIRGTYFYIDENGNYIQCAYRYISSYESFEKYLNTVFTPRAAESFFEKYRERFRVTDDGLFMAFAENGRNTGFSGASYSLTEKSDDRITFECAARFDRGGEKQNVTYPITAAKTENGLRFELFAFADSGLETLGAAASETSERFETTYDITEWSADDFRVIECCGADISVPCGLSDIGGRFEVKKTVNEVTREDLFELYCDGRYIGYLMSPSLKFNVQTDSFIGVNLNSFSVMGLSERSSKEDVQRVLGKGNCEDNEIMDTYFTGGLMIAFTYFIGETEIMITECRGIS